MHRSRPFLSLAALLLLTWGLPCSVVAPCQEQKLTHSAHLNLKRFGYISNNYFDFSPVARNLSNYFNKKSIYIKTEPDKNNTTAAEWVLITNNKKFIANPVIKKFVTPWSIPGPTEAIWTDDYSNLLGLLRNSGPTAGRGISPPAM